MKVTVWACYGSCAWCSLLLASRGIRKQLLATPGGHPRKSLRCGDFNNSGSWTQPKRWWRTRNLKRRFSGNHFNIYACFSFQKALNNGFPPLLTIKRGRRRIDNKSFDLFLFIFSDLYLPQSQISRKLDVKKSNQLTISPTIFIHIDKGPTKSLVRLTRVKQVTVDHTLRLKTTSRSEW